MALGDLSFDEREAARLGRDSEHLQIRLVVAGGWHSVRLAGELDLASTGLLYDASEHLATEGAVGLSLDLREVEFIDSTGLRAVLTVAEHCRAQGIEFRVIPGPAQVQRLFEVTGLLERLPFEQSEERSA